MRTFATPTLAKSRDTPLTCRPLPPTRSGTDTYDSSPKERIPAYCDRILYRTPDPTTEAIVPLQYRAWSANVSDHKPITALFETRIKKMVPSKRQRIWEDGEEAWRDRACSLLADAQRYYL